MVGNGLVQRERGAASCPPPYLLSLKWQKAGKEESRETDRWDTGRWWVDTKMYAAVIPGWGAALSSAREG